MKLLNYVPAITADFDSTNEDNIVLVAHTVEHGRIVLGSIDRDEWFALLDKHITGGEQMLRRFNENAKPKDVVKRFRNKISFRRRILATLQARANGVV